MKILTPGTKVVLDNIRINEDTRTGCFMPPKMRKVQGKVVTIRRYLNYDIEGEKRYDIEGSGFTYTDDMFSLWIPKNLIGGELL